MRVARCLHCGFVGPVYGIPHTNGVSAPFCPRCGLNSKLDFKNVGVVPRRNVFVWLKHRTGFHSNCAVPCHHPDIEEIFTCRITFKEFSKEGRWIRLRRWLRSFRKK